MLIQDEFLTGEFTVEKPYRHPAHQAVKVNTAAAGGLGVLCPWSDTQPRQPTRVRG